MIVITPKQNKPNQYYLFRNNGDEVFIEVFSNQLYSSLKLTKEEKIEINDFLNEKPH